MNKEMRDPVLAKKILAKMEPLIDRPITLMEVCGTHTMALFRHGLRSVLPPKLRLLSGPGCPVCVTPSYLLDGALDVAQKPGVILTTFGDMLPVPGSKESLGQLKATGADIRIVYSPLDSVRLAEENPNREVVFFAVGFETTAPSIAATVLLGKEKGLKNFSIIGAHKTVPGALRALFTAGEIQIDGLICPGHVSAVIGTEPYRFLPEELGIATVITGFEPVEMLQGIYLLLKQINESKPRVETQYRAWVPPGGNPHALEVLYQVFEPSGAYWRGLGFLPDTGLTLREDFAEFDAIQKFKIDIQENPKEKPGCRCGDVLKGLITPLECPLFAKVCLPEKPVGACMVSLEGTCAAYYKYGR